jgi:hypothetical protein
LKLGAVATASVRRIKFTLVIACPAKELVSLVVARLRALPTAAAA